MVKIGKSTIPQAGKGVFATQAYSKNDYLGTYAGVVLTPAQYRKRDDPEYTWELYDENDDTIAYLDAKDIKSSNWARYVNCPCTKKQENVKAVQQGFRINYYAKKRIEKGDELFVWYGPNYGLQLIGREVL